MISKFNRLLILSILIGTALIFSCTGNSDAKRYSSIVQIKKHNLKIHSKANSITNYLYVRNDSLCVLVQNKTICISKDTTIECNKPYDGIYEIKDNSFKRSYSLLKGQILFFTTFQDLGFGYRAFLYAYDLKNKTYLRNFQFKSNYLYSSNAIFIFDKKNIFSIDKPGWYDKYHKMITIASMYRIKDDRYSFKKNLYEFGEKADVNDSLFEFYSHTLFNDGIKGGILPSNWWK